VRFLAALMLSCTLLLGACTVGDTTTPVTPLERLVQAEGAYRALDATVRDGVRSGLIVGERAGQVKAALTSARVALDAWHLAPGDSTNEQKFLLALQAARGLLQTFAPKPKAHGPPLNHEGVFA